MANSKKKRRSMNTPWMRNAVSSIGVSGINAFKDIIPHSSSIAGELKGLSSDAIHSLRNGSGGGGMKEKLANNQYLGVAKRTFDRALSDLKQGKFNNEHEDAADSMSKDMGFDDDFDDWGDDWDYNDEDDGDVTFNYVDNSGSEENYNATLYVADSVKGAGSAILKGQQSLLDALVKTTNSSIEHNQSFFSESLSHISSIDDTIKSLLDFHQENTSNFYEMATAYFEKMGSREEDSDFSPSKITGASLFDSSGKFSVSKYKDYIKQQVKHVFNNSQGGAVAGFLTPEMLEQGLSNPMGSLTKMLIKKAVPKDLKESMKIMDDTLADLIPTVLGKIGDMSANYSDGKVKGTLKTYLSKILGFNTDRNDSINIEDKVSKDAAIFDKITRHSIVEVIPKHLAEQTALLKSIAKKNKVDVNGALESAEYFDPYTGGYTTRNTIKKRLAEQIDDAETSAYKNSDFQNRIDISGSKLTGKFLESYSKLTQQMLAYMTRSTKNITASDFDIRNDSSAFNEILGDLDVNDKYDKKALKVLKEALLKMSATRTGNDVTRYQTRARQSYEETRRNIEDNYDEMGVVTAGLNGEVSVADWVDEVLGRKRRRQNAEKLQREANPSVIDRVKDYSHNIGSAGSIVNKGWDEYGLTEADRKRSNIVNQESNGIKTGVMNAMGHMTTAMEMLMHGAKATDVVEEAAKIFSDSMKGVWNSFKENFADPLAESLFGVKNKEGYREGGLISGTQNKIKDGWNYLRLSMTGKEYTDSKGNKRTLESEGIESAVDIGKNLFKDIGEGIRYRLFGDKDEEEEVTEDGKKVKKKRGVFKSIIDSFKEGVSGWKEAIFGDDKDAEESVKETKEHIKKALPAAAVAGGVGMVATGSMSGSVVGTLIGGPFTGLVLGSGLAFAKNSNSFQRYVFGTEITDDNGNVIDRVGGLVSKHTQDLLNNPKVKKSMLGGAAIGLGKNIIFGSSGGILGALVGGPLAGAIIGASVGLMKESKTWQEFIYGNPDTGKEGIKDKWKRIWGSMNKPNEETAKVGKVLGMGAIGGVAGGLTSAVIGNMGVLGAALTPFGPIGGAVIGTAIGLKASGNKFKELLFGRTVIDENGDKHKKGGLFGKLGNWLHIEVVMPFKSGMLNVLDIIKTETKFGILEPLRLSIEPVGKWIKTGLDKVNEKIHGYVDEAKNEFKDKILKPVGDAINALFSPIRKIVGTMTRAAATVTMRFLSLPFKLLKLATSRIINPIAKGVRKILKLGRKLIGGVLKAGLKVLGIPVKILNGAAGITEYLHRRFSRNGHHNNGPRFLWGSERRRSKQEYKAQKKEDKAARKDRRNMDYNRRLMAKYTGYQYAYFTEENKRKAEEIAKAKGKKIRWWGGNHGKGVLTEDDPQQAAIKEKAKRLARSANEDLIFHNGQGDDIETRQLSETTKIRVILNRMGEFFMGYNPLSKVKDNINKARQKASREKEANRKHQESVDHANYIFDIDSDDYTTIADNIENAGGIGRYFANGVKNRFSGIKGRFSNIKGFFGNRRRAKGGDVNKDKAYLVGDGGKDPSASEIFVPKTNGRIIAQSQKGINVVISDIKTSAATKWTLASNKVSEPPFHDAATNKSIERHYRKLGLVRSWSTLDDLRDKEKERREKTNEKLEKLKQAGSHESHIEKEEKKQEEAKKLAFFEQIKTIKEMASERTENSKTHLSTYLSWFGKAGKITLAFLALKTLFPLLKDVLIKLKNLNLQDVLPDAAKTIIGDYVYGDTHHAGGKSTSENIKDKNEEITDVLDDPTNLHKWNNLLLTKDHETKKETQAYLATARAAGKKANKVVERGKDLYTRAADKVSGGRYSQYKEAKALEKATRRHNRKKAIKNAIKTNGRNFREKLGFMSKDELNLRQTLKESGIKEADIDDFINSGKKEGLSLTEIKQSVVGGDSEISGTAKTFKEKLVNIKNNMKPSSIKDGIKNNLHTKSGTQLAKTETKAAKQSRNQLIKTFEKQGYSFKDAKNLANSHTSSELLGNMDDIMSNHNIENLEILTKKDKVRFKVHDIKDTAKNMGSKVKDTSSKLVNRIKPKPANIKDIASKTESGILKKAIALFKSGWKTVCKKIAGKVGGKGLFGKLFTKVGKFLAKIIVFATKHIGKIAGKLAKILGAIGGTISTGLGALALLFKDGVTGTIGGISEASNPRRLFITDKEPDWIMTAIAAGFGVFKNISVGLIVDVFFTLYASYHDIDPFSEIALIFYDVISRITSGGSSAKYDELIKSRDDYKEKYNEYASKEQEKEYKAYLKSQGKSEDEYSYEQFQKDVADGKRGAGTQMSYLDYNNDDHKTVGKRVADVITKHASNAFKTTKSFFGGKDEAGFYDPKTGIYYTEESKGVYKMHQVTATDATGKPIKMEDLGQQISEKNLPNKKDMVDYTVHKKGVFERVKDTATSAKNGVNKLIHKPGEALKDAAGAIKDKATGAAHAFSNGFKNTGKNIVNFGKNTGTKISNGIADIGNGVKDVLWNNKFMKKLRNLGKNVGKPFLDYMLGKSAKIDLGIPEDNPGAGIIHGLEGILTHMATPPRTLILGSKAAILKFRIMSKLAAKLTKGLAKETHNYMWGKSDHIDVLKGDDDASGPLKVVENVTETLLSPMNSFTKWGRVQIAAFKVIRKKAIKAAKSIGKKSKDYMLWKTDGIHFGNSGEENNTQEVVGSILENVLAGPRNLIGAFRAIKKYLGEFKNNFVHGMKSFPGLSKKYVLNQTDHIRLSSKDDAGHIPLNALGGVTEFFLLVPRGIVYLFNKIKEKIGPPLSEAGAAISDIKKQAGEVLDGKIEDIKITISEANPLGGIIGVLSKVINMVLKPIKFFKDIFGAVGDKINDVVGNVKDAYDKVKDKINDVGGKVKDAYDWVTRGGEGGHGEIGGKGDSANNYPYFSQKDSRWGKKKYASGIDSGNMADDGCGPTAMAMVATNYKGNYSPTDIAADAVKSGYRDETGTNAKFISYESSKLGLNSSKNDNPTAEYIKNNVGNGKSMILNGVRRGAGDSAFTSEGHYVVAVGKDKNGNILVNDPRGKSYSKAIPAEDLAKESRLSWAFNKSSSEGGRGSKLQSYFIGGRGGNKFTAKDVIAVAKNEIGYKEKASSSGLDKKNANPGKANYTKYNLVVGSNPQYWCAAFIDWVFYIAANKDKKKAQKVLYGWTAGAASMQQAFINAGRYTKKPKAGDIVFFSGSRHGGANHVGIVVSVNGNNITTVEGNTSSREFNDNGGCVASHTYAINNSRILGFGRPLYDGTSNFKGDLSADISSGDSSSSSSSSSTDDILSKASDIFSQYSTKAMNGILTGKWDYNFNTSDSGSGSSSSSSSNSSADFSDIKISGGDNPKKVWDFFDQLGYSDAAKAAILGNFQQESGMNPKLLQNGKGPAAGILQWEDIIKGNSRWKDLDNYAKKKGKKWTDLQTQLERVHMELPGGYFNKTATYSGGTRVDGKTNHEVAGSKLTTYKAWKNSTDVDMATRQFEAAMERASIPLMDKRIAYAKQYYKKFTGSEPTKSTKSSKSSKSVKATKDSPVIKVSAKEKAKKDIKLFDNSKKDINFDKRQKALKEIDKKKTGGKGGSNYDSVVSDSMITEIENETKKGWKEFDDGIKDIGGKGEKKLTKVNRTPKKIEFTTTTTSTTSSSDNISDELIKLIRETKEILSNIASSTSNIDKNIILLDDNKGATVNVTNNNIDNRKSKHLSNTVPPTDSRNAALAKKIAKG